MDGCIFSPSIYFIQVSVGSKADKLTVWRTHLLPWCLCSPGGFATIICETRLKGTVLPKSTTTQSVLKEEVACTTTHIGAKGHLEAMCTGLA